VVSQRDLCGKRTLAIPHGHGILIETLKTPKQGEYAVKLKIGDKVRVRFGWEPKNKSDACLAAARACNMTEHLILQAKQAKIEWAPIYIVTTITKLMDEDRVVVDGEYTFKLSDVSLYEEN